MDLNDKEVSRKWSMVREQLITLWAFNKQSNGSNDFESILTEGFNGSFMNLSMFTQISYFLLGIINQQERDKLIKWPVVNIQGQYRFRKELSTIVKDLIENYPYFRLKRLPESYLMDPNGNQKKILDFVLRLSNLALYIALNDPSALIMSIRDHIDVNELETATYFTKKAKIHEEKIIEENEFPTDIFNNAKINLTKKCVALKQENCKLQTQLNKLKTNLVKVMKFEKEDEVQIDNMKQTYMGKLDELKKIYEELKVCSQSGNEVINHMKSVSEPVCLRADDFGLNDLENNLKTATIEASNRINQTFYSLKLKEAKMSEKEDYFQTLQNIKKALTEEKQVLESFIAKCSNLFIVNS